MTGRPFSGHQLQPLSVSALPGSGRSRRALFVIALNCSPPYRKVADARVLLLTAEGADPDQIACATGRSKSLVERTRNGFVLSGPEAALWDKRRQAVPPSWMSTVGPR